MGYQHFSGTERLELAVLLGKGFSRRDIARALGRSHSSVIRELRNGNVKGQYDPRKAHHKAQVRRQGSKYQGMKIREHPWLERYLQRMLERGWTPEEIAGRLRAELGQSVVSFKAIYKWLYSPFGQPWCRYLPAQRYRPRQRRRKKTRKVLIPNRIFIDQRPREAEERRRRGHFEADTLGVPRGAPETIAGAVDRRSRYFLVRKIGRLAYALEGYGSALASVSVRSLTLDNSVAHVRWEALGIRTYFCHPYRAWEKPTIENTFQRLRRYIPKGSRLRDYPERKIAAIVEQMNDTPRKCLGYRTPREVFEGRAIPTITRGWCT